MTTPSAKQLAKHPLRYYLQHLRELMTPKGDERLLGQVTFTLPRGRLLITCHDPADYTKLKEYQALIPVDFQNRLGIKETVVQYDVSYLILITIHEWKKQGKLEFTLEEMVQALNGFSPQRKESLIKPILQGCAKDYTVYMTSSYYEHMQPQWLLELRGAEPVIRNLGNGTYQIVVKTKGQPTTARKK